MVAVSGPKAKVEVYGLVRDKNGNPRVDGNPDNLPKQIKDMLTPEDWAYLKGKTNADS